MLNSSFRDAVATSQASGKYRVMQSSNRSIRALDSVPLQRWKNGAGTTRELALGQGWRVSVADVASDCEFSVFERMTRTSVVLCGKGLRLQSLQAEVKLLPDSSTTYNGDVQWRCALLGGPAVVLNVMSDAMLAEADVRVGRRIEFGAGDGDIVVIALDGSGSIESAATVVALPPDHFLVWHESADIRAGLRATGGPETRLVAIRLRAITFADADLKRQRCNSDAIADVRPSEKR